MKHNIKYEHVLIGGTLPIMTCASRKYSLSLGSPKSSSSVLTTGLSYQGGQKELKPKHQPNFLGNSYDSGSPMQI
jgi:hypothetical protein